MERLKRLSCIIPKITSVRTAIAASTMIFAVSSTVGLAAEENIETQKGGTPDFNSCARPEYPEEAQAAKRTGTVTMALLIGIDGKVKNSRITQSSGHLDLDDAARAGLSQCKFFPGKIEGKLVEAWTLVQYVWSPD